MTYREFLFNLDTYRLAEKLVQEKYDYADSCSVDCGRSKYAIATDGTRISLIKINDFTKAVEYQKELIENYPNGFNTISNEELAKYLIRENSYYEPSFMATVRTAITTDNLTFNITTEADYRKVVAHQVELLESEDFGNTDF